MVYTDRQVHCLTAMGLVAWQRRDAIAPGANGTATEAVHADEAIRTAESSEAAAIAKLAGIPTGAAMLDMSRSGNLPEANEAVPSTIPGEPAVLATWLPDAALAPFSHRERTLTRVGRAEAGLLVIVERTPGEPANLPLQGAADALFENMLRAIGLSRRDTCQCVLSNTPMPEADTVGALAARSHKVSLVLLQQLDPTLSAEDCRLSDASTGRPTWCVPHPEQLIASPERKRQAWNILSVVSRHLAQLA